MNVYYAYRTRKSTYNRLVETLKTAASEEQRPEDMAGCIRSAASAHNSTKAENEPQFDGQSFYNYFIETLSAPEPELQLNIQQATATYQLKYGSSEANMADAKARDEGYSYDYKGMRAAAAEEAKTPLGAAFTTTPGSTTLSPDSPDKKGDFSR